jgi:alpha-ketoglutarate-dependent taurine dioxygenase
VLQHARTDFDPAEKRVLRRVPIAENEVAAVA